MHLAIVPAKQFTLKAKLLNITRDFFELKAAVFCLFSVVRLLMSQITQSHKGSKLMQSG